MDIIDKTALTKIMDSIEAKVKTYVESHGPGSFETKMKSLEQHSHKIENLNKMAAEFHGVSVEVLVSSASYTDLIKVFSAHYLNKAKIQIMKEFKFTSEEVDVMFLLAAKGQGY